MNHGIGPLRWLLVAMCIISVASLAAQQSWRRCYGGGGSDEAMSVQECIAGGYVAMGTTGSFGNGASDIYLVRIDESGAVLWSKFYGGPATDVGADCVAMDNGFLLSGTSADGPFGGYDMWLARTDPDGGIIWQTHFGGADWDICEGVEAVSDGFLLFGQTFSGDSPQGAGIAIRIDPDGAVLWERSDNSPSATAYNDAASMPNGQIAVCGSITSEDGDEDGLLVLLNSDGSEAWSTVHGGAGDDRFNGIVARPSGGCVVIGTTESGATVQRIHLCAFDSDGVLLWERFIGNTADAGGADICRAQGSGYALTGYNTLNEGNRDMIFTRVDDDGWFQTGNNFGDGRPADGRSIAATSDGGYILAGWIEEVGPGPRSVYAVKTDANGQTAGLVVESYFDPVDVAANESAGAYRVVPNPAIPGGRLRLEGDLAGIKHMEIRDALGRQVGKHYGAHEAGDLVVPVGPSGMHVLVLKRNDGEAIALPFLVLTR